MKWIVVSANKPCMLLLEGRRWGLNLRMIANKMKWIDNVVKEQIKPDFLSNLLETLVFDHSTDQDCQQDYQNTRRYLSQKVNSRCLLRLSTHWDFDNSHARNSYVWASRAKGVPAVRDYRSWMEWMIWLARNLIEKGLLALSFMQNIIMQLLWATQPDCGDTAKWIFRLRQLADKILKYKTNEIPQPTSLTFRQIRVHALTNRYKLYTLLSSGLM